MPDVLVETPSYQAFGDRAEVRQPVLREHLPAPDPSVTMVQISQRLTAAEHGMVAEWLREWPDVWLRVYAEGWEDGYDFLDRYAGLRRFSLAGWTPDALRRLPEHTTHLWLEFPRAAARPGSGRASVAPLERLDGLLALNVEGPTADIEVVGRLRSLEELAFRSCRLEGLDPFTSLDRLRTLEIRLGSLPDLRALPRIGRLRYLELWRVARLSRVSALGELDAVQHVFLQSMRAVDALPPMRGMTALRRVTLDTMKGIRDLRPLRDAPVLEELVVIGCTQLREEDFSPLRGHPTLTRARVGTGSLRRNAAIQSLLGLPDATTDFVFSEPTNS